ncbi:MAG: ParA family protein [Burkholderiales bacterium]|nr:ParA family protein [Burkholderiales bacterium]
MARIVVFNQKGGVGKTTTTLNLAALLARRGSAPLVIDMDPQAHMSAISGTKASDGRESLYAFYQEAKQLADLIRTSDCGWSIIPAHLDLTKVDTQFGKGPRALQRLNAGIVREHLNTSRPILMDACPQLGTLSLNGIFACDRVLIPISADYLAVNGALQIDRTLHALERVLEKPPMRRFVITRFDTRRKMSWDIDRKLRERFGAEMCETRIAESVSLAESPAHNRDVFSHAPQSRGARDYTALLEELDAAGFTS